LPAAEQEAKLDRDLWHRGQTDEVVTRVAEALAYAHSNGIVHRDVKPGNIFMVGKNQPKVLDFGIAQVSRKPVAASGADTVLGSPTYMAPECVRGESVDGRSDIWSLGVVLYELLTGRPPFAGETLQQLLHAILSDAPQPPHVINPAVPLELARISARALAKRPEDRYQNAKEMSDDLKRWLAATRVKRLIEESGSSTAPVATARAGTKNKRMVQGLLATGLLLAVGVLLYQQFGLGRSAEPVVAAPAQPVKPLPVVTAPSPLPAAAPVLAPPPVVEAAPVVAAPEQVPPAAPDPAQAARTQKLEKVERDRKLAAERAAAVLAQRAAQAKAAPAAAATGQVALAISPWGEVLVNGVSKGTSPPLTTLTLPVGKHSIEVRNGDLPPYTVSVEVDADNPVRVRHKFGG
ncbi:MAG: serine/threonine protein kinase, partial [Burkholderiaceae bacterium]